jgi:hypothetical protein
LSKDDRPSAVGVEGWGGMTMRTWRGGAGDSSSMEDLKGGAGPDACRGQRVQEPVAGREAAEQEMEKAGAIGTRVSS